MNALRILVTGSRDREDTDTLAYELGLAIGAAACSDSRVPPGRGLTDTYPKPAGSEKPVNYSIDTGHGNGNSMDLGGGNTYNPATETGDGSRPASAAWLFAVLIWRLR